MPWPMPMPMPIAAALRFCDGLRTLTLQTGRAFQDLKLRDDEFAIRVGGSASRTLFGHYETQAEATGSASRQMHAAALDGRLSNLMPTRFAT